MKFLIDKINISFNTIIASEIEVECKGNGSKEDPLIIDSVHSLPEVFRIRDSHLYVNFIGCIAKQVTLMNAKHVTFKHSNIRGLTFIDSNENILLNSIFSRNLVFRNSHHNSIDSCNIRNLNLINSNDNYFKKDKIIKVKDLESKNNKFEDVVISKRLSSRKTIFPSFISILSNRLSLYGIYIIGIIIILCVSFIIAPLEISLILIFVFLAFFLFFMVIPDIYKKKKKKLSIK